jgi:hypothetical protein
MYRIVHYFLQVEVPTMFLAAYHNYVRAHSVCGFVSFELLRIVLNVLNCNDPS